jgi:hypothetical protein
MIKKIIFFSFFLTAIFIFLPKKSSAQTSFNFASISDAHVEVSNFTNTMNQIKNLNPNFIIFNGDVENDGVTSSEMDPMINIFGTQISKTFLVRGNHDNHLSGSYALWENYFNSKFGVTRSLPSGVTNYVAMDSSSTYLNYSFDYGNSRFIGLDVPGDANLLTSAEYTFLNSRLTDAENKGLAHAFIFWHGPEYCVEDTHCGCQTTTGCGPTSQLTTIINNHPILSASFHGHEHILAWAHMSSTRVPAITAGHEYEEFITSSAGNPYGFTPYPARMDYYSYSSSYPAFATVSVNGSSFTVSFYHTGTTTPVWTKTFTDSYGPNPTATPGSGKPGDINGDGYVNILDIGVVIDNYTKLPITNPAADVNHDGAVNILDIGIIIDNYGK